MAEFKVNVRFTVDTKTAETCLSLLEMYCNDNNLCISEELTEDGFVFLFRTRRAEDGK